MSVLKDGKPRDFQQLLREAGFSHNTLRMHLASLERQGFIVKDKKLVKRRGRPVFIYSLPPEVRRKVSLTITNHQTTIVSLTFQRFRHLCKFEKTGYCKKVKRECKAQKLSPNPKRRIKTILHQISNILARELIGSLT